MTTPTIKIISPRWHSCLRSILVFDDFHGSVEIEFPKDHPDIGFIWNLWVDDGYRSQGRGTALLKTAEDYIALIGCSKAVLDWDKRDSPLWVLQWYERQGYHETEFGPNSSRLEKTLTH